MKNILQSILAICLLFGFSPSIHAQLNTNSYSAFWSGNHSQELSDYDLSPKKKKKKKKKSEPNTSFQHGLGATLFIAPPTAEEDDNSAIAYGLTYIPSIQLVAISDKLSLRLAASPTVGVSGSVNSREGGDISFAFELPVDAEVHFGNQELEGFGGHIGAGFAYNRISSSDLGDNKAYGPHFTAGIKAPFKGRMYTIRASFLLNLDSKKDDYGYDGKNIIGASIATYF